MTQDTTIDDFLGGQLTLEQPRKGYRAGIDPVLLAGAVAARPGQAVLELGCGTGAALLCLATRVSGLDLHGVEVQPAYADLCRANAARNGIMAHVHTADLQHLPAGLRAIGFDHVIANPPYFNRNKGNASATDDRDLAFAGATPLAIWIDIATRRLKPKGQISLIQKADRLPDILSAIDDRLGSVRITPLSARVGQPADRVIVRAVKGSRAPFRLTAPVVLHQGSKHLRDQEDYTECVTKVLRDGAEFQLPD